jgi:signal transduction histidine kinase
MTKSDPRKPPGRNQATEGQAAVNFLSATMHDLRNTLSAIQVLSHLGAMRASGPGEKEIFHKIDEQVQILFEMFKILREVHTPEEPEPAGISALVQAAVEEVRPVCESMGIQVDFQGREDCEVSLKADLLQKAVRNLLQSSIQTMPGGGKLRVEVSCGKTEAVLSISDTGSGIPEDLQDTFFKPYAHPQKGIVGLSAYLVHQVVTQVHRGQIDFQTEKNRGTTFLIRLPIQ